MNDAVVFRAMTRVATVVMAVGLGASLIGVAPSFVSAKSSGARAGESLSFADFPLWKDVPGPDFVKLAEGRIHASRWGVYASNGSPGRKNSRFSPCITVAEISSGGIYDHGVECGSLAPAGGIDIPPIHPVISGSISSKPGGPEVGEAIAGISFSPEVVKAWIGLDSSGSVLRATKMLSKSRARKAHLAMFRYLALPFHRDVCISNVTGYDSTGSTILDADTYEC